MIDITRRQLKPLGGIDGVVELCEPIVRKDFTAPELDSELPEFCHHYSIGRPVTELDLYGRMIIHPVCTKPGVVPIESYGNDQVCVEERINKVRNRVRLSGSFRRKAAIFARLISAKVGTLVPLDHDEVFDTMPRADKAAKIKESLDYLIFGIPLLRSFQKKEAYGDMKAPRNISPVPDRQLVEMSRFVYPFYARLKQVGFDWFAPGMPPAKIGLQVARVTKTGDYFGADYSKWDGHQNTELRRIVLETMKMCFIHNRDELEELFDHEFNAKARTSFGVCYDAEGTMLSGSAITTVGNTLLNAFVYFCSYIRVGMSPEHALDDMSSTAILYGDDSGGPKKIERAFFEICASLGVKATSESVEDGMIFLGRLYYRDGSPYSIFDPERILPKIHLTCAPRSVPVAIAACNKAHGLKAMCKGEFWVENICDRILRDWGNLAEDKSYWSSEDFFKAHLRDQPGLPETELAAVLPVVCKKLGLEQSEFILYAMSYDDEVVPRAWWKNGKHEAHFAATYFWDSYSTGLESSIML